MRIKMSNHLLNIQRKEVIIYRGIKMSLLLFQYDDTPGWPTLLCLRQGDIYESFKVIIWSNL